MTGRFAAAFAALPGLHGVAQAALCAWHGRLFAAPAGYGVLTAGDFLLCGGMPGPQAGRLLAQAWDSQKRAWIAYAPGPWAVLLPPGLAAAWREGFHPLAPGRDLPVCPLPRGYTLRPMDILDVSACLALPWAADFVREHPSPQAFLQRGCGALIRDPGGEIAAGASAYLAWPGGIEVQLQTREDCQGRGLATAAAAALLRLAWAKGLTVSWDAANPASAHIARKLGFSSAGRYQVWTVAEQNV